MLDAFEAEVLVIDDAPASEVSSSETSEPSAPIESQQEQSGDGQLTEQSQPETLAQPKAQPQQPAKQQSDKTQPAKDGTPEQAQETLAAKAAELDRADQEFSTGDVAGMAQTFEEMFGENPQACAEALWMGLRFLEQRAPEHLSNFSRMVVADQLGGQGVWNSLERIYESAQKAGAQETLMLLDKLAGGLRQQYGIGPATPQAQESDWSSYTKNVGAMMEKSVDADIVRAFGSKFSNVLPGDRQELMTAARIAVRDLLSKDQKLGAELQKLNKSYSVKEGVKVYFDVIEPQVRALVPRIVQSLANQHAELFKASAIPARPQPAARPAQPAKPAIEPPRSMAEARARGMSLADILKETEGEIANGSFLTQADANSMGDMDILSSQRIPQHKKPWRPESIFDEATS